MRISLGRWTRLVVLCVVVLWVVRGLADTPQRGGGHASQSAAVKWNEVSRQLVAVQGQDPVYASRTYALLSVSQCKAAVASEVWLDKSADAIVSERNTFVYTAVSEASIYVLRAVFRDAFDDGREHRWLERDVEKMGLSGHRFQQACEIGKSIAKEVMASRVGDRADASTHGVPPQGVGLWKTLENRPPIRPQWGNVRPMLIGSPEEYLSQPPPQVSSQEFLEALQEVRDRTANATASEQDEIKRWSGAVGTSTPAGLWNEVACEHIARARHSESEASQVLCALNVSMFDAGVVCWRVKYRYWLARPSQIDPTISPALHVPNFPAYISGHSCFSGAASEVLGHFFPECAEQFRADAVEASNSRISSGLHYRFDCDEGLRVGRSVGVEVLKTIASDMDLRKCSVPLQ